SFQLSASVRSSVGRKGTTRAQAPDLNALRYQPTKELSRMCSRLHSLRRCLGAPRVVSPGCRRLRRGRGSITQQYEEEGGAGRIQERSHKRALQAYHSPKEKDRPRNYAKAIRHTLHAPEKLHACHAHAHRERGRQNHPEEQGRRSDELPAVQVRTRKGGSNQLHNDNRTRCRQAPGTLRAQRKCRSSESERRGKPVHGHPMAVGHGRAPEELS